MQSFSVANQFSHLLALHKIVLLLLLQDAPAIIVFAGNMNAVENMHRSWKLGVLPKHEAATRSVTFIFICHAKSFWGYAAVESCNFLSHGWNILEWHYKNVVGHVCFNFCLV